jgi:hypothetical protein
MDASSWNITVEYRGRNLWAVCWRRECLGLDRRWDFESSPSNRADSWLKTHRFGLAEALRLAEKMAPVIRINGYTAMDALALHRDKHGSPECWMPRTDPPAGS